MANVSFSKKEWDVFCREHGRFNRPTLWRQLHDARNGEDVDRVLRIANENFEGHGVEPIRPEEAYVDPYYQDVVALYVNFGDTYAETLLYDTLENTFHLGSWGDFLASWEAIERRARDEDQENDVCGQCGLQFPIQNFIYTYNADGRREGICTECRSGPPPIPTWEPDPNTLVCMLRSKAFPIAVHLFDPIWDGSAFVPHSKEVEDGDLVFAFSVPVDGQPEEFHARDNSGAGGHGQPYTWNLRNLIANMTKWPNGAPEVLKVGNVGVRITPDQYARFRVLLDAFLENGMRGQAIKEALVTPPLLFTCSEINYMVWDEGESGHNLPAAVEVFARAVFDEWERLQDDGFSIWSASGEDLQSLLDDGFFKWRDDNSMRKYLAEIGVCR